MCAQGKMHTKTALWVDQSLDGKLQDSGKKNSRWPNPRGEKHSERGK